MGLFQKKILPISAPKYTLGHQDTKLIVALGNIGKEYEHTRHNMGFLCIDAFASKEEFNPWVEKKDLKSILCAKLFDGKKVILCKPTTMMNHSGDAVQLVQNFYKISDENTAVVYDELALDFGTIRTVRGGADAGHNGIKSLVSNTSNKFWRIRCGIGPKKPEQMDTADYVLQNFNKDETSSLDKVNKEVSNLALSWLSGSAEQLTVHTENPK